MEYIDGDLLDSYIEVNTPEREYGERTVANVFSQLLRAVSHCHSSNVIHRDINPTNIMLTKNNDIRLIDFGFATQQHSINTAKYVGDPNYTAPEVFEGRTTTASDMWSLGVVLYQMVSGHLPFKQKSKALTIKDIMANEWLWRSPEFDNISKYCKDLIKKLLQKNPKQRITAEKAMNHKWFRYLLADDQQKVDDNVLGRLTTFKGQSTLKRAGLDMLVGMISQDEIKDLKAQFEAIDKKGDGTIEIAELKPLLKKQGLRMDEK